MKEHLPAEIQKSLERFSQILSPAEINRIIEIQMNPLPTGIRVNVLKADPKPAIEEWSARYGWKIQPIPFCENGWTIHKSSTSPGTTIEHRMGQYYLQDAASMVPVSLFDMTMENSPLILDMAASPGGKTTHLIDRTFDRGFILANDASKSRISALRSVLSGWGGINFTITQYPGESFGGWYPETFDRVLLDAPCSMENLRPVSNHPMRETTTDERIRLQERQIQLLASGLRALKIGGQLVYATCSLAPEEDEAVIDALLDRYPDAFSIEEVSGKIPFKTPGLTQFEGRDFHPDLKNALRLWPHLTGMSGFYSVLLTKTKAVSSENSSPPSRDFSKTDLEELAQADKTLIINRIKRNYGLDLDKVLRSYHLELYQRHEQVFFIPQGYIEHFSTLPYSYIGMPIGRWVNDILEPAHEFISRFGRQFTQGIIRIDDERVEQWIAGRDIRHPDTDLDPRGQYLLVTDESDRNLGLGKLLPKRLRNMLPRGSI